MEHLRSVDRQTLASEDNGIIGYSVEGSALSISRVYYITLAQYFLKETSLEYNCFLAGDSYYYQDTIHSLSSNSVPSQSQGKITHFQKRPRKSLRKLLHWKELLQIPIHLSFPRFWASHCSFSKAPTGAVGLHGELVENPCLQARVTELIYEGTWHLRPTERRTTSDSHVGLLGLLLSGRTQRCRLHGYIVALSPLSGFWFLALTHLGKCVYDYYSVMLLPIQAFITIKLHTMWVSTQRPTSR